MNEKLWSILVAICFALAGFSLKFAFDANAKIQGIESKMQSIEETNAIRFEQLKDSISQINNDKETDNKQDKNISKLWKLSGWSRDRIHTLEFSAGMSPTSWPDLNE